jgi:hypothetical protein
MYYILIVIYLYIQYNTIYMLCLLYFLIITRCYAEDLKIYTKYNLHKLANNKLDMILQTTFNDSLTKIYNDIITTASNNKTSYTFNIPFCIEPTSRFYNIVDNNKYYKVGNDFKLGNEYKLMSKQEFINSINSHTESYQNNHKYLPECPINDGYSIWSYVFQQNQNSDIVTRLIFNILDYDISVYQLKKYIIYFMKRIQTIFPDSKLNLIINNYNYDENNYNYNYYIFKTNCCPIYNISW